MIRSITFNCIILLVWEFTFLYFASAAPNILKGKIKDLDNRTLTFEWRKTEQLLANEHLPVWIANPIDRRRIFNPKYELKSEEAINKRLGEFVFYQDKEKLSAIVYYPKQRVISGIIDTRILILSMPLTEINVGHKIGSEYVDMMDAEIFPHTELRPLNLSMPRTDILKSYTNTNINRFDTPTHNVTKLYAEILVMISFDIVAESKSLFPDTYLEAMVSYYLIFFNAVDMLISSLSNENIQIHLNIAGFIIEGGPRVFPFKRYTDANEYANGSPNTFLNATKVLEEISLYLHKQKDTFPPDSFDFFFFFSQEKIWSSERENPVNGFSKFQNNYKSREDEAKLNNSLGAILEYSDHPAYTNSAHELAHLFNMSHDGLTEGLVDCEKQCYAIMQTKAVYCQNCLKWSQKSQEEFNQFATTNVNRCFLLNYPRSLFPYGTKIMTLSPIEQCRCYGFKGFSSSDNPNMLEANECDYKLKCTSDHLILATILPLDGSPCGRQKVCWNRSCQAL